MHAAPAPNPAAAPLSERAQQLRTLWQTLPAYVSAFGLRRAATP